MTLAKKTQLYNLNGLLKRKQFLQLCIKIIKSNINGSTWNMTWGAHRRSGEK